MASEDGDALENTLARCALGDRRAFEALYRHCAPHLYALILRTVRERELAGDILQEAFVRIWRKAGDYRPQLGRPMTWMGTIARNQAIDALRRSASRPRGGAGDAELLGLADDNPGPRQQTEQTETARRVHECLDRLQGMQREAMVLAYFEDLTHEELSERLRTPLGTVKSWIRRGLMRLRECLESL